MVGTIKVVLVVDPVIPFAVVPVVPVPLAVLANEDDVVPVLCAVPVTKAVVVAVVELVLGLPERLVAVGWLPVVPIVPVVPVVSVLPVVPVIAELVLVPENAVVAVEEPVAGPVVPVIDAVVVVELVLPTVDVASVAVVEPVVPVVVEVVVVVVVAADAAVPVVLTGSWVPNNSNWVSNVGGGWV